MANREYITEQSGARWVAAMKERPILFSGAMVRALLAGTKTQTRRACKLKPWHQIEERDDGKPWPWMYDSDRDADHWVPSPYGQRGDLLWVREAWRITGDSPEDTLDMFDRDDVQYRADEDQSYIDKYRPSIHMPRRFSRITLEVTDVRVERLQNISYSDALAEGIVRLNDGGYGLPDGSHYHFTDPRICYWSLWDAINGQGATEVNPWVWVVSFQRVQP